MASGTAGSGRSAVARIRSPESAVDGHQLGEETTTHSHLQEKRFIKKEKRNCSVTPDELQPKLRPLTSPLMAGKGRMALEGEGKGGVAWWPRTPRPASGHGQRGEPQGSARVGNFGPWSERKKPRYNAAGWGEEVEERGGESRR